MIRAAATASAQAPGESNARASSRSWEPFFDDLGEAVAQRDELVVVVAGVGRIAVGVAQLARLDEAGLAGGRGLIVRRGELRDKVIRVDDFPYDFGLRQALSGLADE